MTIFDKLLHLYSRTGSNRTPREDFTTELFAEVLRMYPEVCEGYLRLLGISSLSTLSGDDYEVRTQVRHSLKDKQDCRIDLAISLPDQRIRCFIENKVNASEGFEQLSRYGEALASFEHDYDTLILGYCTRYYVRKDGKTNTAVHYLRWADVDKLIQPYLSKNNLQEDSVLYQFTQYLRSNGMGAVNPFELEDLVTIKHMRTATEKMDSILEPVRAAYCTTTGRKLSNRATLQQKHKRYAFVDYNILGTEGSNDLGFGFDLADEPKLYVWLWYAPKHTTTYEHYKEALRDIEDGQWQGTFLRITHPLVAFMSDEDPETAMISWFTQKFKLVHQAVSSVRNEHP